MQESRETAGKEKGRDRDTERILKVESLCVNAGLCWHIDVYLYFSLISLDRHHLVLITDLI